MKKWKMGCALVSIVVHFAFFTFAFCILHFVFRVFFINFAPDLSVMETKRTIDVIINPIAGVRPKDEIPALVRAALPRADFDVSIRFTERAGHASELAADAVRRGVDTVVAIGGDGTINETARSLVGSRTALGLVPMGSGNGLARHIQIPLEAQNALQVVREGHREAVDYGTVNGHIFFCTAGIGFDAKISEVFSRSKERGGLTYLRNVLDLLHDYKPSTYELHTDDERIRQRAFLICIGNASQWGNHAMITPRASMQDGQMDITLVKPFPMVDAPQMVMQLFNGTLDRNDHCASFRSAHTRIVLPHRDYVHVDGEPIEMEGVLDIQTVPAALQVLTPRVPMHNVLEPIQYAFAEVHYSIQNYLRSVMNLHKLKL